MARKPTVLAPELRAEILARGARGESAETIHAALKPDLSVRSIRRLISDSKPTPKKVSAEPVDVPEVIPEGAPLEIYDKLMSHVQQGIRQAERDDNLAAVASLVAKATALAKARQQAMPIPKTDPNENPDMRALAKEVEKRFLALIHEHLQP